MLFIHELVHLYTHAKFGNLTHTFFKEGVASLIGQCAYKNISTEQHFKNIAIWVKNNPNYKFDDLLNLKDFDKITNVSFSIAALLCKDIQNQKGKGGLFRVLYGGETDNELYETLEQVLNLKRANIDTYIKNQLKKYE